MKLICSKRDSYDYLLHSRDPHARVYSRNPVFMLDLVGSSYFVSLPKSHNFHQLPSRDATLYLNRLLNGYYGMLDSRAALGRYDRVHVLVVGTRLFVLVKRDLTKGVDDVTNLVKDRSVDHKQLASTIRAASDLGPLVGLASYNRNEFTSYIPEMANLLRVVNMTNEQVVQELENAMIEDDPDPAMPNISDKDRIVQHGFDLKTSFRSNK